LDAHPNAPQQRRKRLAQHLDNEQAKLLLIGEASGYQGCRYSGMTFTSERLLLEGAIPRIAPPAKRLTQRKLPFSEPSATIVWGTLQALGLAEQVILWNAFPWHPMKGEEPHSNRTPSQQELSDGLPVLEMLLDHYQGIVIIAVGKKAAHTLTTLGIKPACEVRHPAMGGANKFREGMAQFAQSTP